MTRISTGPMLIAVSSADASTAAVTRAIESSGPDRWRRVASPSHGYRRRASDRRRGPRRGERGAVGAARRLVAAGVHRRRRPRVRGPDPARWSRVTSPARDGCSTSAVARARSPAASPPAAPRSSGSTRRQRRSPPREPRRRPGTCAARAEALPVRDALVRHRRGVPRPRARRGLRDGDPRGGPGARARRTLRPRALPPAPPGARQRMDRRPDPGRAVLADRRLPRRRGRRSTRWRRASTCSSSTDRSAATSTRWAEAGLLIEDMTEETPPPRLVEEVWGFPAAATIPRVMLIQAVRREG